MRYSVSLVDDVSDRPALAAMLEAYYALMLGKLTAAGGPLLDGSAYAAAAMDNLAASLPPHGRLALAHDELGALVGFGFLSRIRPDAGELKRLYVLPEARKGGLGRRLVEARIQAAREMGWRRLYADTIKGNREMLLLYDSLGFRLIPRYPENGNLPELEPWFVFLEKDLSA